MIPYLFCNMLPSKSFNEKRVWWGVPVGRYHLSAVSYILSSFNGRKAYLWHSELQPLAAEWDKLESLRIQIQTRAAECARSSPPRCAGRPRGGLAACRGSDRSSSSGPSRPARGYTGSVGFPRRLVRGFRHKRFYTVIYSITGQTRTESLRRLVRRNVQKSPPK